MPLDPLRRRFRLIVPDRPGYGATASLRRRSDIKPSEQATWLRKLLRREGAERPVIAAHSIAAAVALSYALRYPKDVAGLVLIAPFCRPTRPAAMPLMRLALLPFVGRWVRERLFPVLADIFGRNSLAAAFAPNPVPAYLRGMPIRQMVRPETLLTMAGELFGFNAAMRRLDVPAVVIAGEADATADPDRHAAWLAERLPRARLVRLPGVGHMPQHARPDAVMRAIEDVARATGRGGGDF